VADFEQLLLEMAGIFEPETSGQNFVMQIFF
jgi:hypothetical protein